MAPSGRPGRPPPFLELLLHASFALLVACRTWRRCGDNKAAILQLPQPYPLAREPCRYLNVEVAWLCLAAAPGTLPRTTSKLTMEAGPRTLPPTTFRLPIEAAAPASTAPSPQPPQAEECCKLMVDRLLAAYPDLSVDFNIPQKFIATVCSLSPGALLMVQAAVCRLWALEHLRPALVKPGTVEVLLAVADLDSSQVSMVMPVVQPGEPDAVIIQPGLMTELLLGSQGLDHSWLGRARPAKSYPLSLPSTVSFLHLVQAMSQPASVPAVAAVLRLIACNKRRADLQQHPNLLAGLAAAITQMPALLEDDSAALLCSLCDVLLCTFAMCPHPLDAATAVTPLLLLAAVNPEFLATEPHVHAPCTTWR